MNNRAKLTASFAIVLALWMAPGDIMFRARAQEAPGRAVRDPGNGEANKADPCAVLPNPPGNAKGIDKQCPPGGSSSGVARGDFNGDGYADLAIAEPNATVGGQAGAGDVIVLYGSATGLTNSEYDLWTAPRIPGLSAGAGAGFGTAMASGDFNGDGLSDLAIGIPGQDITVAGTKYDSLGQVVVIYGSRSGLTTSDSSVPAPRVFDLSMHFFLRDGHAAASARLGQSLAWGDFNGDGAGDLAIGAPKYTLDRGLFNTQKSEAGAVWVVFGIRKSASTNGGLTTVSNLLIQQDDLSTTNGPSYAGDHFGSALTAGDFDKTGQTALAIGVPDRQKQSCTFIFCSLSPTPGIALVVASTAVGLDPTKTFLFEAPSDGAHFGAALAAGDFDHDGFADLAVGEPDSSPTYFSSGSVHVVSGPFFPYQCCQYGNSFDGYRLDGFPHSGADRFGAALAAGDFNADGYTDLAIGAPNEDQFDYHVGLLKSKAGEVDVLYGGTDGLRTAFNFPSTRQPDRFNQNAVRPPDMSAGYHFGASLSAWNFGRNEAIVFPLVTLTVRTADLAIGIPNMTVNGVAGAGAIAVMYGSYSKNGLRPWDYTLPDSATNVIISADSIGLGGLAGAHFGTSLY